MAKLGRLGYIATPFAGNVPDFDLLVGNNSGRSIPVQVKAINGPSWHFCLAAKACFVSSGAGSGKRFISVFALLNLGLGRTQSLAGGVMSSEDAIRLFYNADNCLYVRKHLKNKDADAMMRHGVQLPDLFNFLPAAEAHRELTHELEAIRSLCLDFWKVRALRSV